MAGREDEGGYGHDGGRGAGGSSAMERRMTCWENLVSRHSMLHCCVRYLVEGIMVIAVGVTIVGVCLDVELATGRRNRSDVLDEWYAVEFIVMCVFFLEAAVLVIARGLMLLPHAFLRDRLRVLDFAMTVFSAVCLLAFNDERWDGSKVAVALKATRAFRVVRLAQVMIASKFHFYEP